MTLEQARAAYRIGTDRSGAARRRAGTHRFGWDPDSTEQRHIDGMSAVAERLVALETSRAWTSDGLEPDAPEAGDVEGGISVRWTGRIDGSLIVHEDEPPNLRCVLVIGARPPLRIFGWMPAHVAQQEKFWRTKGVRWPAFFVPQNADAWRDISALRLDSGVMVDADEIQW